MATEPFCSAQGPAVTCAWPCSLQAPGGAAGEHEKERDGKRPLPVLALRGAARAAGEHLGLLSGLQKGEFAHRGSCLLLVADLARQGHRGSWKGDRSVELTYLSPA